MLIGKIQFECNADKLSTVRRALSKQLGNKIASVTRGWHNYCVILRGIELSDLSKANDILSEYYKKGILSYYEVGHFDI